MKQRIQNKKRIACLCGYFVFVAFLSYTLGKYVQNTNIITKVEVTASDYERVYEAGAPYEDEKDGFGKYYIHYTGEKSGEERTKVDIAEDMKDGKICGTVPDNTYKLFSNCSSKVDRVILVDGLASSPFSENMFVGTSHDIQLIYKDSTNLIDRTDTVFSNNKVMTYLYLTPEYLENDTYKGTVKNIFVSKEIGSLQSLFSESQTLEYALFDENGTWTDLMSTFFGTTKFHITNYGFALPQQLTDISYTFVQSAFNDADMEIIKDKIPDTVTYMERTFAETALTKIPEGFILPSRLLVFTGVFADTKLKTVDESIILPSTVEDVSVIFADCPLLETVSSGLFSKMNGDDIEVSSAFSRDEKLHGYIEMPKENIWQIGHIFEGAGTSAANMPGYSTPIVMVYNPSDPKSLKYATTYTNETNIYHKDQNPNGKVTAITYDEYNLKNHFEKVSGEGPYTDSAGVPYYLKYVGPEKRVDLNDYASSDGKIYWRGQEINSTYKLFKDNKKIDRVILTDEFKDKTYENNMFDGTSQDIQLIYKDDSNMHNHSQNTFSNGKVKTYLYLIDNHLNNQNQFIGSSVKNVFVSKEVKNISNIFNSNSHVEFVLFDEKGKWTNMDYTFKQATSLSFKNYGFQFPNTITQMKGTFSNGYLNSDDLLFIIKLFPSQLQNMQECFKGNSNIGDIPSGVVIPNTVINMTETFANTQINKVADDFRLPASLTEANQLFLGCTKLSDIPELLFKDIKSESLTIDQAFYGCDVLNGYLKFPFNITSMNECFKNAGKNATNLDGADTPIVIRYDSLNKTIKTYTTTYNETTNIYHNALNTSGKVSSEASFVSVKFQKVLDENGPYTDKTGNHFYLQYNGKEKRVDLLDYIDSDDKLIWSEANYSVEINTTYKMFSHNNSIEQVLLPHYLKDSIVSNTFEGSTEQDIDLIYRDDIHNLIDSSYDVDGHIYEITQPNVLIYANIEPYQNNTLTAMNDANFKIPNVHIAKNVQYTGTPLFGDCLSIQNVLFEEGSETTNINSWFKGCQNITKLPPHFQLPAHITNAENAFAGTGLNDISHLGFQNPNGQDTSNLSGLFAGALLLKEVPDSFSIPYYVNSTGIFKDSSIETVGDNVTIESNLANELFMNCQSLKSIGKNFTICSQQITSLFNNTTSLETIGQGFHTSNAINMSKLFYKSKIQQLPISFIIPKTAIDISEMFEDATEFRGDIRIPATITNMNNVFKNAGTSITVNIPIKMIFNPTKNTIAKAYADGNSDGAMYSITNTSGRVIAVNENEYFKNNGVAQLFEKVYDDQGPYTWYSKDGATSRNYYLRYIGDDTDVDFRPYAKNGTLLWYDEYADDGTPIYVHMTSTYKMFEGRTDITKIILPRILDSQFRPEENMFKDTTQEITLIYYADVKNETSDYSAIEFSNPNAMAYFALTDDNALDQTTLKERVGIHKNIYIQAKDYLISEGSIDGQVYLPGVSSLNGLFKDVTTLEYVLFEDSGTWKDMTDTFNGATSLHLTNKGFKLPETATQLIRTFANTKINSEDLNHIVIIGPAEPYTDASWMFYNCKDITTVPNTLVAPGNRVIEYYGTFEASGITSFPEDFEWPNTVARATEMFKDAKNLGGIIRMPLTGIVLIDTNFETSLNFAEGAGVNCTTNVAGYDTPIVLVWDSNKMDKSYIGDDYFATYNEITNFYHPTENPSGKITPVDAAYVDISLKSDVSLYNHIPVIIEDSITIEVEVCEPVEHTQSGSTYTSVRKETADDPEQINDKPKMTG